MFKTISVLALTALYVLFISSTGVDAQSDGCSNFQSVAACASAASQPSPILCTWDDDKGCVKDACQEKDKVHTCGNATGCVWMGWSQGVNCFSASLLCSNLNLKSCGKYPFCTERDSTYCAVVGVLGANKVTAECDVNFPKWSIALMFVWLIIMIILAIIVALAAGKAKQQKVQGIEENEEVVVDSVQLRDNFQLGDPLNQPEE